MPNEPHLVSLTTRPGLTPTCPEPRRETNLSTVRERPKPSSPTPIQSSGSGSWSPILEVSVLREHLNWTRPCSTCLNNLSMTLSSRNTLQRWGRESTRRDGQALASTSLARPSPSSLPSPMPRRVERRRRTEIHENRLLEWWPPTHRS